MQAIYPQQEMSGGRCNVRTVITDKLQKQKREETQSLSFENSIHPEI
jgi:hypothetical protein